MKETKKIIIQGKRVFPEKIKIVKADRYKTIIYYYDGEIENFSLPLGKVEELIQGYGLYRINYSTIIDLDIFKAFIPNNRYHFLTIDKEEMSVSISKWKEFKRIIYE